MLATMVLEALIERLNKMFERESGAPIFVDETKIHCLGFCDDLITIASTMEAGVCPHDSNTGKLNIMVFGPYEVDGSERIQANTKGLPRILHREET